MENRHVFELIAASGPNPEHAEKLMLYGQFVGSWDIEAAWFKQGKVHTTARGEWHFTWILGGRGVQDVLFAAGSPADHYGVTLRCYDPTADVWRVSWMQPYGGEFVNLIGRQAGERIVQEGAGGDPTRHERWTFSEITSDSFLWTGEVSLDGGVTWNLEQQMRAARKPA